MTRYSDGLMVKEKRHTWLTPLQIVSTDKADNQCQKQIIQMKWGKPYGTPIPVLERRLSLMQNVSTQPTERLSVSDHSLTNLQKEIARRMNVKTSTVDAVLSRYWRNDFVYPRKREYNYGPRHLTEEGRSFLMDFENLKKYGAVSLEGRSFMVEQNFPGCRMDRWMLSKLYKNGDYSYRKLGTGLQSSRTPVVSAIFMLTMLQPSEIILARQAYVRDLSRLLKAGRRVLYVSEGLIVLKDTISDRMQLDSTSINLCAFPARIWQPKGYPLPLRKPKNRGRNQVSQKQSTDTMQTIYGAIDTHDSTVYHYVCDTTNRVNVLEFLRRIVSSQLGKQPSPNDIDD